MSDLISTKPYMVRAIHEWCVDNALTPHLLVVVNAETRVPMGYVKDGEIVLNLNYTAIKDLHIDNDAIVFSARFGGVPHNIYVPMSRVKGVFARENGQGMFFEVNNTADTQVIAVESDSGVDANESAKQKTTSKSKASLRIVK
ncbi:MAG: ClpXP protease specificity-enhancing factor [Methylophilus sp.]